MARTPLKKPARRSPAHRTGSGRKPSAVRKKSRTTRVKRSLTISARTAITKLWKRVAKATKRKITRRRAGSAPVKPAGKPASRTRANATVPLGRRVVVFVIATMAVAVVIGTAFGDRGWLEVRRRGDQQEQLAAEVAQLEANNVALAAQIEALKSDSYVIEKLAREKLGYAKSGEAIFLFPEEQIGPSAE